MNRYDITHLKDIMVSTIADSVKEAPIEKVKEGLDRMKKLVEAPEIPEHAKSFTRGLMEVSNERLRNGPDSPELMHLIYDSIDEFFNPQ